MTRVVLFGLAFGLTFCSVSLHAQVVLSPRRLTQRIAPQTAPAGAPAPAPGQAPVVVVQPPVDPVKAQAEHDEATRKAADFRKQREAEGAQGNAADTNGPPPVLIQSMPVTPDPDISLQMVNLSLTNSSPRAITKITMDLVYLDKKGDRVGDWVTRRELDPALAPKAALELAQPAYHMPIYARRVKAQLKEVHFADGSDWVAPVH